MSEPQIFDCHTLSDTERVGNLIAAALPFPACVYLRGDLGAGKTTLCKSIIRGLGYEGSVTSPTYNLIQEYPVAKGMVYHLDLYRLQEPDELEYLALADIFSNESVLLVEWPDKGVGRLPKATHTVIIRTEQRSDNVTRHLSFSSEQ